ncbi:RNA chaperone Hfq [Clostridium botulinum]|nr:RNA chaperone Hfq [Clostridium botulinum]NFO98798.1 RNA chaperone Hfq [Clostridium botulinum]QPW58980.1 RNA chaperone Hfq [Clostridium botulinum]QPW61903.1 RNA chaperone Hfq [Clostridium botulinum]
MNVNKSTSNLQDLFLNNARRNKVPVIIYLTNGFQLNGLVQGFDNFTIILDNDGKQMMIYKHAVSTIIPTTPILFNPKDK